VRSRYRILVGLVLAVALIGAACSDDDTGDETTTTTEATEETTTTTAAPETTTTAAPETTTTAAALAPLVVWADDKFGPIIEQIAVPFTEQTSVPVSVTVIDYQDMREQITTQAPAGEGPDVFIGAHDWLGEMVANGIAAPQDLGANASNFAQVSLDAFSSDGNVYAMPYAIEAVALFYNADLVPTPPATVEELTASCDELADTIDNCWGIQGGGSAGDAFHNFPFVATKGGYVFGFDPATGFDVNDIGLDSEGAIAGVAAMEQLVADGYIAPIDEDDAKQLFIDGKQAFFMSGPWWINTWDEAGINWGVATLPTLDGDPMAPFVGVRGFYISEFGENKAIAEEFLNGFVATDETMLALFEADPRGPAWLPIQDQAVGFEAFAESASNGLFMPNVPEMGAVWEPLGNQLLGVRNLEVTAEEAMTQAAEQVANAVGG
jgi:maltose-binding protein MalE